MSLSNGQQKATGQFLKFLASPIETEMALLGHSGTGKTFLTNEFVKETEKAGSMIRLLTGNAKDGIDIECTAMTNKAAGVLQASTTRNTKTIHSLLALKVFNNFGDGTTSLKKTKDTQIVRDTLVIIDEASMVNNPLLKIIRECTRNCKTLYVLDPYQLLDVHSTDCVVTSSIANQARLTETQRFADGGPIAQLAEGYRQCIDTLLPLFKIAKDTKTKVDPAIIRAAFPKLHSDGKEIQCVTGPEFKSLVDIQFKGTNDKDVAKIVAWTNGKVNSYNSHVRDLNNMPAKYAVGEYVTTAKPINGMDGGFTTDSIVQITGISDNPVERHGVQCWKAELNHWLNVYIPCSQVAAQNSIREAQQHGKDTKDWQVYFHRKEFFTDLRPIHSSTVHKSQGSTYGKVFIDVADIGRNQNPIEVARLMYVAATRASEEVILYGTLPWKYGG